MLSFITENLSTIIVGAVVAAVVVLIVLKLRKDKKKGTSCSCGSACSGCPSSGMCHRD